ncbi:MAG: hypothetical protein M1820_002210 [Bogoriella megaspora]|nr:MAG: hypothetical protein M1820_002210 [Bogoriella megaspora]
MSSHSSLSITSKQSLSSPVAAGAAQKKGSPIKRKPLPLHQRIESEANQHPTIRLVDDPEPISAPNSPVYSKNPFPIKPSQILHPSSSSRRVPQDRDRHVSDAAPPPSPAASTLRIDSLLPAPLQPKTSLRGSTSTITSDNDTRLDKGPSFSPSSSRFPSATFSKLSAPSGVVQDASGQDENEENDTAGIPADIRPILPSLISKLDQELSSRASDTSLASSASSDALTARQSKLSDRPESSSTAAGESTTSLILPDRNPNRPLTARSRSSQRSVSTPIAYPRPILKRTAESIAGRTLLSQASIERLRTFSNPSAPWHAALQATLNSGARVQFPTVKPPTTSGSWASVESGTPPPLIVPKRSVRMTDRASGEKPWGSRLSTIPSESERSHAFTGSGVTTQGSSPIERRRTRGSLGSSFMLNATAEEFENLDRRLGKQPMPHDSDEHEDIVGELTSPGLRPQRSGSLGRLSDHLLRPESSLSDLPSKRSSYGSYVAATLPAWARRYYSLGDRTSLFVGFNNSSTASLNSNSRLNTADTGRSGSPDTSNLPLSIFHPRKRPRMQAAPTASQEDISALNADPSSSRPNPSKSSRPPHGSRTEALRSNPHRNRDSLAITDAPVHERLSVARPLEARRVSLPASPHLRHDRRSVATAGHRSSYRLSAWRAPSLEEVEAGWSWVWGPEGRQVTMFALGFVFPFAWMIAAFLPLPKNSNAEMSEVSKVLTRGGPQTRSQLDIEATIVEEVGSLEDRRFQKAKWWRWANRGMSVVGLAVIGAIVALIVIAVHM